MTLAHLFPPLMVVTFLAAVLTLLVGIGNLAGNGDGDRSTRLMVLRVGLCALLLAEILIYITFLKP
jgi:hypothetical protein